MYGTKIPLAGKKLLAKLLAGDTLLLTDVMVGSGVIPTGFNPDDITDLFEPVALASSTVPIVKDCVCSLTVEYRNDMNDGLKEDFMLNEFGIFAEDPTEGRVLLLYGTLGDMPQPVMAYDGDYVDVRRFPVSIVVSDDIKVIIQYMPSEPLSQEQLVLISDIRSFHRLCRVAWATPTIPCPPSLDIPPEPEPIVAGFAMNGGPMEGGYLQSPYGDITPLSAMKG